MDAFEAAEEQERDKFFGDSAMSAAPAQSLLQKMETFVTEFSAQLREMESAVADTLAEPWSPETDPIGTRVAWVGVSLPWLAQGGGGGGVYPIPIPSVSARPCPWV